MMFSGFRSRWMTPPRCALASAARQLARDDRHPLHNGKQTAVRFYRPRSVSPSDQLRRDEESPSISSNANTVQMPGVIEPRPPAAIASRS